MNINEYIKPLPPQLEAMKYVGKGVKMYYGGARGAGKSALINMINIIITQKFPGITAVAFRQTFKELEDDLINKLLTMYPENVFNYTYKHKNTTCHFKNGSRILYRAVSDEKSATKAQGIEYQFMAIDEANNWDTRTLLKMPGSLRPGLIKGFSPTLLMTGNPGGQSDKYFKTRFVFPDHSKWNPGEIKEKDKFIFINAKTSDNIHARDFYIPWLETLPEKQRLLWLEGSWDAVEGQFFEDWSFEKHVCSTFEPPKHWRRLGGLDLGYSTEHPTVLLLLCQDPDTQKVYVYKEYYQWGSVEQYIDEMSEIIEDENLEFIFADPSMWSERKIRYDDESPARMFMNAGLVLTPADNKRVNGWRIMKQWMEKPLLQIMDCCSLLIETLPTLKYRTGAGNTEDLNSKGQDDACDALRYALIKGFQYPLDDYQEPYDYNIQKLYYKHLPRAANYG